MWKGEILRRSSVYTKNDVSIDHRVRWMNIWFDVKYVINGIRYIMYRGWGDEGRLFYIKRGVNRLWEEKTKISTPK